MNNAIKDEYIACVEFIQWAYEKDKFSGPVPHEVIKMLIRHAEDLGVIR